MEASWHLLWHHKWYEHLVHLTQLLQSWRYGSGVHIVALRVYRALVPTHHVNTLNTQTVVTTSSSGTTAMVKLTYQLGMEARYLRLNALLVYWCYPALTLCFLHSCTCKLSRSSVYASCSNTIFMPVAPTARVQFPFWRIGRSWYCFVFV